MTFFQFWLTFSIPVGVLMMILNLLFCSIMFKWQEDNEIRVKFFGKAYHIWHEFFWERGPNETFVTSTGIIFTFALLLIIPLIGPFIVFGLSLFFASKILSKFSNIIVYHQSDENKSDNEQKKVDH